MREMPKCGDRVRVSSTSAYFHHVAPHWAPEGGWLVVREVTTDVRRVMRETSVAYDGWWWFRTDPPHRAEDPSGSPSPDDAWISSCWVVEVREGAPGEEGYL